MNTTELVESKWDEVFQSHIKNHTSLTALQKKKLQTVSQTVKESIHNTLKTYSNEANKLKEGTSSALQILTLGLPVTEPEDVALKEKVDEMKQQLEELISKVTKYRETVPQLVIDNTTRQLQQKTAKIKEHFPTKQLEHDQQKFLESILQEYNDLFSNLEENLQETADLTAELEQQLPKTINKAEQIAKISLNQNHEGPQSSVDAVMHQIQMEHQKTPKRRTPMKDSPSASKKRRGQSPAQGSVQNLIRSFTEN